MIRSNRRWGDDDEDGAADSRALMMKRRDEDRSDASGSTPQHEDEDDAGTLQQQHATSRDVGDGETVAVVLYCLLLETKASYPLADTQPAVDGDEDGWVKVKKE